MHTLKIYRFELIIGQIFKMLTFPKIYIPYFLRWRKYMLCVDISAQKASMLTSSAQKDAQSTVH